MNAVRNVVSALFLATFCLQFLSPPTLYADEADKKKEELLRKIQALKSKKAKIDQQTKAKLEKQTGPKKSLGEIIAKYERLFANCKGKKSERCADVMYSLGKLYYDKARDEYIKSRQNYEKAMDRWEKNPSGPEPVNPIPNYTRSVNMYIQSVKLYPDFIKADEGYYQIGTIQTLNGNLDLAKDAFFNLVKRVPNSIRASAAHFRLAEFCFMDRDFTCALKHIEKIKQNEINPEVQEMAHYRKAEIYYNRAEFDIAANLFFSYVEKCDRGEYPKKDLRYEALEYLAICFSDMPKGAQKAINYFKKKGKRPYEDYIIYTVGMKNFNHGQYDQAKLALKTALKNFPYYIEAPLAQQMIVACFIIRKKYGEANVEREKLVDYYSAGSEWASRNSGDAVAIEKAAYEVRKALASIPIFYHADAQKKKNKALFEKAIKRYQQYIDMFPKEKWKVYEFKYNMAEIYNALHQYEKAAQYYDYVASQSLSTYPAYKDEMLDTLGMEGEEIEKLKMQKKKSTPVAISQEDAGYNAIVALDNLRKKKMRQGGLTDAQSYAAPETKKFIEYIHSFVGKFPKSSNSPEVLYIAGNVHYSAKSYDAAIVEFKNVITNYSHTKYGGKALRMLANTYSKSGEYNMALEKYKQLLAKEKPNTKGYKEVIDLAAISMFQSANALKKTGSLIGAADAFKSIYAQFPTSKIAAKGWFEAGAVLEDANNNELAALTFKELGNKFPKSKLREKAYVRAAENYKKLKSWEAAAQVFELAASKIAKADYAIPSLSAAAENYKKAKRFNKAGLMYETILHKYPTDKRTPLGIYNAGLIYEKGKMYKKAIDMYTALGTKYPESEYAAEGYYSIGFCFEKLNNNVQMARAFTSYAEKFTANRSKQVMALVRAAEAYMKMKNYKEAEKNANTASIVYEKFKKKASIDPVAPSKAYYIMGEIRQKEYNKIGLKGKNEKQVRARVQEKTKALEPVLKAYAKAIELGVGEWTIRSTYQIGKSFVDFAGTFRHQSLFGSKDQKIASKIKIISQLEKYYTKAMEKFQWNINTAYEQNIKNKYVKKSTDEFMRIAFKKGYLFEEIGLVFKKAPVPRGMSKEDIQVYKDVLEEKYLEALDAALPKYEEAVFAAKDLGIVQNAWLDSVKSRISFINPSSQALTVQLTARPPKTTTTTTAQVTSKGGGKSSSSSLTSVSGGNEAERMLARALQRINEIVDMKIPSSEKIAQLLSIENDAKREIEKEEETIADYKEKLGIN